MKKEANMIDPNDVLSRTKTVVSMMSEQIVCYGKMMEEAKRRVMQHANDANTEQAEKHSALLYDMMSKVTEVAYRKQMLEMRMIEITLMVGQYVIVNDLEGSNEHN